MGKATGIIGQGGLAFTGQLYRTTESFVLNREARDIFTGFLNESFTFFS